MLDRGGLARRLAKAPVVSPVFPPPFSSHWVRATVLLRELAGDAFSTTADLLLGSLTGRVKIARHTVTHQYAAVKIVPKPRPQAASPTSKADKVRSPAQLSPLHRADACYLTYRCSLVSNARSSS